MDRIVIIGLGLIGGSLGMGLKASKLRDIEIVGVDCERDAALGARKKGAVDSTERMAAEAVKRAQLVILATPLMTFPEVLQEIAPHLPEGCVVTDTGSTKAKVMEWAEHYLPRNVSFVGGHPMAGRELAGIDAATTTLFQEATYCIVPAMEASKSAVEVVVGLASSVGAKPYFVGAAEHDMLVAGVSHLPLVLSAALVGVVSRSPSWNEMAILASSGFRDVSRLASTDPGLSRGISLTNQSGMLYWLDGFIQQLNDYRTAIAEKPEAFLQELAQVRDARDTWLLHQKQPAGQKGLPEVPSAGQQMMELFVGSRFSELLKKQEDSLRDMEKRRGPRS